MKTISSEKLQPHCKLWVSDQSGNLVFGSGRHHILTAIEKCGSMNKAASELKMSFRTLWGRIRETEKILGFKLVENKAKNRAEGSVLTPEGKALLENYNRYRQDVIRAVDRIFKKIFT